MARFAFVTWAGGGNVPPAIGIGRELVARGHEVRFLGYEAQREQLEATPFGYTVLARSGAFDVSATAPGPPRQAALIRNVWACPEHLDEVPGALAEHGDDAVVVDFMMQGALAAVAAGTNRPRHWPTPRYRLWCHPPIRPSERPGWPPPTRSECWQDCRKWPG